MKVGQDIDIGGGLRARVQEDEQGNLFYAHPTSGHRTVVVPAEQRDLIGGESVETDPRDFSPFRPTEDFPNAMEDQESILNSLIGAESGMSGGEREGAHSSIDGLIMENELNKVISQSPGSRLRGPLDALGNTLAEYLIGQNPETGEIPTQPYPYNPLMNLLNLPPGNQMKTGGFSKMLGISPKWKKTPISTGNRLLKR
jgi:hypothetical protein